MVDVGSKAVTNRKAIASGEIFMNKQAFDTMVAGKIRKATCYLWRGLLQFKAQTNQFLNSSCHPIAISHIDIEFKNYLSSPIELIVTCLSKVRLELKWRH